MTEAYKKLKKVSKRFGRLYAIKNRKRRKQRLLAHLLKEAKLRLIARKPHTVSGPVDF